jgi:hypothetical protein
LFKGVAMFLRAAAAFVAFGLVAGSGRPALSQTFPVVAPQAAPQESNSQDSERLRRINEQLEIRRSGTQLRTRNELAADLAATRAELDRLSRLRDCAASFLAGRTEAADLVGVSGLLQQVGHLPSVVAALQATAPELVPEDFVQQSWGDVVEPDGRLTPPPRFLRVVDGYESLQNQWNRTAEDLSRERSPSDQALLALEETVADWSATARPKIRTARSSDGREALVWLNRLSLFLRDLDEKQLDELGRFLRSRGHTFPGGTVGELLSFLVEQRLNLQPSRPGQIALATAGAVILAETDADIAVLEDRIEFYKQQESSGGSTQPGRMIYRTGSTPSGASSLPRREPLVPASQLPMAPVVNVAADRR